MCIPLARIFIGLIFYLNFYNFCHHGTAYFSRFPLLVFSVFVVSGYGNFSTLWSSKKYFG
jgi:hypothetical protein